MKPKTCEKCGQEFSPRTGSQSMCDACKKLPKQRVCLLCKQLRAIGCGSRKVCDDCRPYWERAKGFKSRNPDCVSTVEELAEKYAASVDFRGEPFAPGVRYVMDHDHKTGIAIGLIDSRANLIMTEYAIAHWDMLTDLVRMRDSMTRGHTTRYMLRAMYSTTNGRTATARWGALAEQLNQVSGKHWSATYIWSTANGDIAATKTIERAAIKVFSGE